jgi:tetratricopeptide (TPR) repeat protein
MYSGSPIDCLVWNGLRYLKTERVVTASVATRRLSKTQYGMRKTVLALFLAFLTAEASAEDVKVPEEAEKYMARGMAAVEAATDNAGYLRAAEEYEAAAKAAPKWPNPRFILGKVYARAGDYPSAIRSYSSYLKLAPNASNAKTVKAEIYKLEYLLEESKKTPSPGGMNADVIPGRPKSGKLSLEIAELAAQGTSRSDTDVIEGILREQLIRTGSFNIGGKKDIDAVLKEQGFSRQGCSSQECAQELGRRLNVSMVVVGSFGKLLGTYMVPVRVLNVETGAVIYTDTCKGGNVGELKNGIADMARRIADNIR